MRIQPSEAHRPKIQILAKIIRENKTHEIPLKFANSFILKRKYSNKGFFVSYFSIKYKILY